jgi:hypothetical protein
MTGGFRVEAIKPNRREAAIRDRLLMAEHRRPTGSIVCPQPTALQPSKLG